MPFRCLVYSLQYGRSFVEGLICNRSDDHGNITYKLISVFTYILLVWYSSNGLDLAWLDMQAWEMKGFPAKKIGNIDETLRLMREYIHVDEMNIKDLTACYSNLHGSSDHGQFMKMKVTFVSAGANEQ